MSDKLPFHIECAIGVGGAFEWHVVVRPHRDAVGIIHSTHDTREAAEAARAVLEDSSDE